MKVEKIGIVDIDLDGSNYSRSSEFSSEDEVSPQFIESIRNEGLLQPIIVKRSNDGRLTLIAGWRRLQAYNVLAQTDIQYNYIEANVLDVDSDTTAILNITENLQRLEPNILQKALAAKDLQEKDFTDPDILRVMNLSKTKLTQLRNVLTLPEKLKEALSKDIVSIQQANLLAEAFGDDPLKLEYWISVAAEISTRALKKQIDEELNPTTEEDEETDNEDDDEVSPEDEIEALEQSVYLNKCMTALVRSTGLDPVKVNFDTLPANQRSFLFSLFSELSSTGMFEVLDG